MRAGGGPGIDIYTGVVISKDDDGRRVTVRYESWYTTPTGSANGDQMDVESIPYTSPLLSFVERKPALALLAGAKMPNTGLSDNDTLTVQATIIEVKGLKKADRGLFDTRKNNVYVTLTLQKGEGKKTPVRISGGNAASYNFEITDKATAESVKWGNLMTVADVKAATSGLSLRVEVYDEDKQKGDQLLGQGSVFVHLKDIVEGGSILTELISLDNIALGYDPKGKPLGSVAVRLHATRNSNAKAKIPAAFPIFAWPGKLQIDRPAREQALGKYVIMDKEGDVRGLVTRIEGQGKNIQVLLLDESLRLDEGQYEWVSFGGKGADGVEMLWYVDAPKLRKTLAEVAAAPTVAPPAAGGGVHGVIAPWSPLVVTTLSAPVRAGDTRIQVESQVGCAAGMVVQIGGAPSSSSSSSSAAAPSGTTPPSDVRKIVGFGSVLVDAPLVNSYAAGTTVSVYSADKAPPLTLLAQSSGDAMDEMSGPPTGGDESAPPPLAAPKDKKPKPAATATAPTAVAAVTGLKLTGPKWPGKLQIDRPVREQALGKYVIMDKEGDVRGLVTRIEGQGKNIQVQLLDESLRLEDGQYEWVGFGGKGADGVEMLWYADLPIVTPTHALSIQATSIEVKGLKKADRGVFDTRKNNVYVKLTLQKGEGKKTPVRISGGNAASYDFETTDKATAESVKWGNLMTVADVKAATSGLSLRVEVYDEDKQKGDQLLGQGSVFVHLKDIVEGGSILTELISLDNIALGYDPKGKPLGSVAVRLQVVATPDGGGKVAAATAVDEMGGPPTGGDQSAPPPLAAPKDKSQATKGQEKDADKPASTVLPNPNLTGPSWPWPGKLQIDRPVREQALGKYVIMDKDGEERGLVTRIEGHKKKIQVQLLDDNWRLEEGQYTLVSFDGKNAEGFEMLWYVEDPSALIVTPTHALSIQATSIEVKGLKKADRGVFDTRKNNVYVKLTLQKGEGKKTPVRISGGNAASYDFETTDKATAESVKWGNLMTVADVKAATSGLSLRVEVYDEDKQKGDQLLGQGSVFVHLKDIVEGGSILTELISLDNIALGYDPKGKPLGSVAVRLQVVATPGGGGGGGKVAAGTSAPAAAAAAVVNGPSAVVAVAGGGGAAVVQPLSSAMSTTPSKDKGSDQDQVKDKGSDKVNENGSDQVKDKVQGSDQDKKAVPAAVTKTVVAAEAPSVTVASSTAGPPIGGPPKRPPPKVPSKAAAGGGNVSTTVAAPVGDATGAGAGTGTEIGADTGTGTGTGKTQASNASTDNAPTSTATTPISSPTPATATASVVDKQPPAVATTAATATGAANKTTTPSPSTENKSKTASDPSPSPSPGPVVASANVGTPVAAATNAATAATTAATVTATTPSNTTPGDKGKDKDKVVPSPAASTSTTTPVKATNPSTAPVPVSVSSAVPVPVATSSSALSPVKSSTANPVVPVAAAGNTGTATITGTAGGNSSSAASKGTGTGTSPATPGAAANTNTAANTPNASSIATPDVVSTNASTAISENKPKTPLPAVGASFESGKKLAPLGSTGTGTGASTTTETPISGQGSASKPVLAPIGGGSISKPALAPITTPANK